MMQKLKGIVVGALCVTVIFLGIGFIALSMKLQQIENTSDVFDVSFSDIKRVTSIKGGEEEPVGDVRITSLGKMIDLNFGLFAEHDEIQYEIKIANNGTVPASIVDLVLETDKTLKDSPVQVVLSDVGGKIIDPGEEISAKLDVYYDSQFDIIEDNDLEKKLSGKIGLVVLENVDK